MAQFSGSTFIQCDAKSFCTFEHEDVLVATRKHWLVLFKPLAALGFLSLVFVGLDILTFIILVPHALLFTFGLLTVVLFAFLIASKMLIDWHYNLYIVTTKKILEANFNPLFSHHMNQVILDQVRVTEVDVQMQNVVQEVLDIGNIVLVFDHISHEERFTFEAIKSPRQIGARLIEAFENSTSHPRTSWMGQKLYDMSKDHVPYQSEVPLQRYPNGQASTPSIQSHNGLSDHEFAKGGEELWH